MQFAIGIGAFSAAISMSMAVAKCGDSGDTAKMSERDDYDDDPKRRIISPWLIVGILAVVFLVVVLPFLALVLFFVALGASNM